MTGPFPYSYLYLDRNGRLIYVDRMTAQWEDRHIKPDSKTEPVDPDLIPIPDAFFRRLVKEQGYTPYELSQVYEMYR